jgi:magnesium-protoporphyrin IX monomethyl ester (oxidative) cyclase
MNITKEKTGILNTLTKGLLAAKALIIFVKLYFLPTISSTLPADVRMKPSW